MHLEINNTGSKTNLEAYYDFNSSSGTTLTDQANSSSNPDQGGANNGILKNMTTSGSGNDWVNSGAALTDNAKLEQGNTFHNDVRGIWPAKTTESSAGLTVSESSSALATQDNVVFGHDGANNQNTNPNNSNYDFSNVSASSLSAVANRQWFVDENAGGKQVDLTFNTKKAGISGFNTGNKDDYVLIEVKSSGKDELIKTASSVDPSNNTISFTNANINGTYTFGSTSNNSPLPVELTSFTVQQEGSRSARLEWATASETKNKHFLVQRRREDQWQQVGQVKGHGTTTVPRDYRFIDNGLIPGTHYYRLKQVDFDGSYEYSDVKAVTLRRDEASQTSALAVYPNPAGQTLNVAFTGNGGNRLSVTIRNAQGQIVYRNEWDTENEALRKALPVSGLQSGAYVLMLKGQNRVYRQRFLKR